MTIKVLIVIGTRPEGIKLAPVYFVLNKDPAFSTKICTTAQHREMLDDVLELFSITPDYDLGVMESGQDLYHITTAVLTKIRDILRKDKPDVVIVQGDTTTTFAASLAAYYEGILVAHVEAGLRTGKPRDPFPEEINRCLTDRLSDILFAPTPIAMNNLLNEGYQEGTITMTGNTVVDALHYIHNKTCNNKYTELPKENRKILLVTAHRRENHGKGIREICNAISEISKNRPDWLIFWPVHPNPNISQVVHSRLSGHENIILSAPLKYDVFINVLFRASLVITDSGGVQEEAASIGKPMIVIRENTERMEAVLGGLALLVEVERESIVSNTLRYMDDARLFDEKPGDLYGDGHAAEYIRDAILERLKSNKLNFE